MYMNATNSLQVALQHRQSAGLELFSLMCYLSAFRDFIFMWWWAFRSTCALPVTRTVHNLILLYFKGFVPRNVIFNIALTLNCQVHWCKALPPNLDLQMVVVRCKYILFFWDAIQLSKPKNLIMEMLSFEGVARWLADSFWLKISLQKFFHKNLDVWLQHSGWAPTHSSLYMPPACGLWWGRVVFYSLLLVFSW